MKKIISVMLVALVFVACNSGGLRGTFVDESGLSHLIFKSGNKVVYSTADVEIEMEYTIKDKKVIITEPNGTVTELDYDGTGALTGPYGLLYTRKKH